MFGDRLEDLIYDVESAAASAATLKNVIEFVDTEIDKAAWGIDLNLQQRAVIKAYYQLELTDEEIAFLEDLNEDPKYPRTTWDRYNPVVYQYLICEAGRRASKCFASTALLNTKEFGTIYGYELLEKAKQMSINEQSFLNTRELGLDSLKNVTCDLPLSVSVEGKNKTAEATNFYIKGQSLTKVITTSCGYEIEATPEHRIKVIDDSGNIVWRYFADIKVGEYAAIHRSTQMFPDNYLNVADYLCLKPTIHTRIVKYDCALDKNWGYLLGHLVGNGSWHDENSLTCTFHSQDLSHYIDLFDVALNPLAQGLKLNVFEKKESLGATIFCSSVKLRTLFYNLGFTTEVSPQTKKVPWSIRQSPRDVQAAFLSGLFAADGCLGKGGRDVSLSTASKPLAREVQLMLLNFGIVSRLVTRRVEGAGKGKDYYWVILRGKRSLQRFADEITFGLPRKQDPLVAYLAKSSRDGGDTERIPYQIKWLKRLRDTLPTSIGKQPGSRNGNRSNILGLPKHRNLRLDYRAIVGNAIKDSSGELLSSYRLDPLLEFAREHCTDREAIEHFEYLQECDYFYDPIVSVEDNEAFCVDLSVPGLEQYVAQGFTNHNSSVASVIVCYEFYRLCYLPEPQQHYGIGSNTPITILVLATTAEQAKGTIFSQICGLFPLIKFFKPLLSKGLVRIGAEEIEHKTKQLQIKSGNSKSSSQVGYSIICLVMDEIARIEGVEQDGNDEYLTALKLWENLGASGLSFGADARRLALSSAWYTNDAIDLLYQQATTDPIALGFRLKTWQLNPKYGRDNPLIASAYKNPRRAALEYEGLRTVDTDGFFDGEEVVACFRGDTSIVTQFDEHRAQLKIERVIPRLGSSCGYLDPAIVKDSYTFAYGHKERGFASDGTLQMLYYVDGFLVWEPSNEQKVSIVHVQECIMRVHQQRRIVALGADHHNSAETVERLSRAGIPSRVYTATNALQVMQYSFARELMHTGRLVLPRSSPWRNKLIDEMTRVNLIRNSKIDHPYGGCFTGDTLVLLDDGTKVPIADLVGRTDCYCVSYDRERRRVERGNIIKIWLTKHVTRLVELKFSNGQVVRCTPDHRFLLQSGDYIAAQELTLTHLLCAATMLGRTNSLSVRSLKLLKLDTPVPVYDMEVSGHHNFKLATGPIVHNSKDISDAVCGLLWLLERTQTEAAGVSQVVDTIPNAAKPIVMGGRTAGFAGSRNRYLGKRLFS